MNISKKRVCPICMIPECSNELNFSITEIWCNPTKIFNCNNCNLYFIDEKPNIEELTSYYKNKFYSDSFILDFIKSKFRFARSISQYKFFREIISEKINNVIEIGSGDALLLSFFKNEFSNVVGFETSKKYKKYAQKKFGIRLTDEDFFEHNGKYDLVIMSHVFEHFLDFNKVYKKLDEILNSGGYFYIEVPNSPNLNEISMLELSSYLNSTHIYNFDKINILKTIPKNYEILIAQRFNYNIKTYLCHSQTLNISRALLDSKLSKYTFIDTIFNISRVIFFPNKFYKKIDYDCNWQGYGDNIRLILKKL